MSETAITGAGDLLAHVAGLVGGDRQKTHGDKLANHRNIAGLWNAYLGIRPEPGAPLSALDAALMMVLLKVARTQLGALNLDDFADMAGYAGVGAEIAQRLAAGD